MARVPKSAIKLPSTLPPIPSTSATPARAPRKRAQPESDKSSPSTSASASTSATELSPRELRASKRQKHSPISEAEPSASSQGKTSVVAKEEDCLVDSDAEVANDLKGKGKGKAILQGSSLVNGRVQSLAAQRRAYKGNKATISPLDSQQTSPASDKNNNNNNKNKNKNNQSDQLNKAKTELNKIKDEVQCSICLSTMVDPYTIGCGHSFCRRCLHSTWHRQDDPPTPPAETGTDEHDSNDDDDDRSSASGSQSGSGSGSDEEEDSEEESEDEGVGHFTLTMNGRTQTLRAPAGATRAQGNSVMDAMRDQMFGIMRGEAPAPDFVRAARLARIEGQPAPAPVAAVRTTNSNNTHRGAARPGPAPAPVRAAAPPPVRMPPTGAERAAKVVCPSCRFKLTQEPPIKVFALSMLCDTVRKAEQVGGALASESEDGKAGATEDEAEDVDENDKTWGGLFHDSSKELSAKDKRARDARPMRDEEDGVWRCGFCNWEVEKDSAECTNENCMAVWDPTLLENDDHDGDDLMNPAGPGGFAFGAGDGDRSEDERSEDEELDSEDEGFIDDGVGEAEASSDDPLGSDNDSARSTPRKKSTKTSFNKRKEERRRQANGRKSNEVIDIDSTDKSHTDSEDGSSASAGPISKRDRFTEIPDSEDGSNSEVDTSLEIVVPTRMSSDKKSKSKKRSSSDFDEDEDEVEEVAKPPARRRVAGRGAAKVAEAKPVEASKGKRRRVIKDSDGDDE